MKGLNLVWILRRGNHCRRKSNLRWLCHLAGSSKLNNSPILSQISKNQVIRKKWASWRQIWSKMTREVKIMLFTQIFMLGRSNLQLLMRCFQNYKSKSNIRHHQIRQPCRNRSKKLPIWPSKKWFLTPKRKIFREIYRTWTKSARHIPRI